MPDRRGKTHKAGPDPPEAPSDSSQPSNGWLRHLRGNIEPEITEPETLYQNVYPGARKAVTNDCKFRPRRLTRARFQVFSHKFCLRAVCAQCFFVNRERLPQQRIRSVDLAG